MIWCILAIIAAAGIVFAVANDQEIIVLICTVILGISIICFFSIPVKGYMKVESIHWQWTVDVYTYSAVKKSGRTTKRYLRYSAENAACDSIPDGAYDVKITVYADNDSYYYAEYSYTIDEWVKTSEVSAFGNDRNPHEPDRPYNTDVPDVLGNKMCGYERTEKYTVTGIADGKKYTYDISKSDWESFYVNAEFGFSKFRFGKELFNVDLAR
jgi:hypothetical protein